MCDHCFILLMLVCTSLLALLPLEKHHIRKAGLETETGNWTAVTTDAWSDLAVTDTWKIGPAGILSSFQRGRFFTYSVHGGITVLWGDSAEVGTLGFLW